MLRHTLEQQNMLRYRSMSRKICWDTDLWTLRHRLMSPQICWDIDLWDPNMLRHGSMSPKICWDVDLWAPKYVETSINESQNMSRHRLVSPVSPRISCNENLICWQFSGLGYGNAYVGTQSENFGKSRKSRIWIFLVPTYSKFTILKSRNVLTYSPLEPGSILGLPNNLIILITFYVFVLNFAASLTGMWGTTEEAQT